jgi:hypothetical protein
MGEDAAASELTKYGMFWILISILERIEEAVINLKPR